MPEDFFSGGDKFDIGKTASEHFNAKTATDKANSESTSPWSRNEIEEYMKSGGKTSPSGKTPSTDLQNALNEELAARQKANDAMNEFAKSKDLDCEFPPDIDLDEATGDTPSEWGNQNPNKVKANKGFVSKCFDSFLDLISDGTKEGDTLTDAERSKAGKLSKKAADDASRDGDSETRTYKKLISRLFSLLTAAGAIAAAAIILKEIADAETGCYQFDTSTTSTSSTLAGNEVCHGQLDDTSCGCSQDQFTKMIGICTEVTDQKCPPYEYKYRRFNVFDVLNQIVAGGVDIADGAWDFGKNTWDFLGKVGKYIGYGLIAIFFLVLLVLIFKLFKKSD